MNVNVPEPDPGFSPGAGTGAGPFNGAESSFSEQAYITPRSAFSGRLTGGSRQRRHLSKE